MRDYCKCLVGLAKSDCVGKHDAALSIDEEAPQSGADGAPLDMVILIFAVKPQPYVESLDVILSNLDVILGNQCAPPSLRALRICPASQPSPHFSDSREGLIERFVLIQILAKSRNERPQPGVRHVWDQLIKHAALPEQRMGSVFGGIDLEMAVHAEAFAGGAEQRQKHDGEGVQKKKPVAPLRIGDA